MERLRKRGREGERGGERGRRKECGEGEGVLRETQGGGRGGRERKEERVW